jgi:hypothetical protein
MEGKLTIDAAGKSESLVRGRYYTLEGEEVGEGAGVVALFFASTKVGQSTTYKIEVERYGDNVVRFLVPESESVLPSGTYIIQPGRALIATVSVA